MRNFNWDGQHIDAIEAFRLPLEIFQKNRHYVMNNVNARIDITNHAIRMNLTTGKFRHLIGDGLTLEGRIDQKMLLKAPTRI